MNEADIVDQLIAEVDAAVPSDVDVRTVGGDPDVDPPEAIIRWSASRLPGANGHRSIGGYITDQSGNKTGIEHHTYWTMEADCTVRHLKEKSAETLLHDIQSAFVPYESSPGGFDPDTREWDVGAGEPRNNPVIEPDWYETGVLLTFEYVKRADETGKDFLTDINYDIGSL